MKLILRKTSGGPYTAKYPVTFTRLAHTPSDFPVGPKPFFDDHEKTAEVWCIDGETPQEVIDYHYGSKAVNVVIGAALEAGDE